MSNLRRMQCMKLRMTQGEQTQTSLKNSWSAASELLLEDSIHNLQIQYIYQKETLGVRYTTRYWANFWWHSRGCGHGQQFRRRVWIWYRLDSIAQKPWYEFQPNRRGCFLRKLNKSQKLRKMDKNSILRQSSQPHSEATRISFITTGSHWPRDAMLRFGLTLRAVWGNWIKVR